MTLVLLLVAAASIFATHHLWKKNKALIDTNQKLATELQRFTPIKDIQAELAKIKASMAKETSALNSLVERRKDYEFNTDLQEASFYQPRYEFSEISQYSEALDLIYDACKALVKEKKAFLDPAGGPAEGDAKGLGKLALNALNSASESITSKVTYSNFEESKEKLRVEFNKLNNLTAPMGAVLSEEYLALKIREMALAYDYQQAQQRIKDEQAELKAQMKEEEEARAEAEKAREKAIKEQERYAAALEEARRELESKSEAEKAEYEAKLQKLQEKLDEATAERERATAMAQITKKGHVYIISNVGSFGEEVFKIGMTRRKEPMDRVKELSDASVPFSFDVHAIIYTEDAPALENELHHRFESRRMNKVNLRKEFFRTNIDDIAKACEEMGHKVRLSKAAEAREFRETVAIEQGEIKAA